MQHQRTKHVEIDLHFVRDRVAADVVHVHHILKTSQYTGIFTKGLSSAIFQNFVPVFMFGRLTLRPPLGGGLVFHVWHVPHISLFLTIILVFIPILFM